MARKQDREQLDTFISLTSIALIYLNINKTKSKGIFD